MTALLLAMAFSVLTGIPYAPEKDSSDVGDLYLPQQVAAETPLVLLIHGGAFNSLNRSSVSGIANFFADRLGCAVFNIDYRLASKAEPWPACGDDCVAAAKFVRSAAFMAKYGFKNDKIWICGGSAGGHLALWTLVNLPTNAVAGVVAISPIGDPAIDAEANPNRYTGLFDGAINLAAMNPCTRVKSGMAPVLITHATGDRVVPIASSRAFAAAYRAAGNVVDSYDYPCDIEPNTGGHCIWRPHSSPHRLIDSLERKIASFVGPVAAAKVSAGETLLTRWCDGLLAHQLTFPRDRGLNGAMVCSACAYLHGRIGDTVYPFVVQWTRTGDDRYLAAARKAIGWCEANTLCADGSYMNDLKTGWPYITVFSQIALGKTLRTYGERLPADFRAQLEKIYARQSRWLYTCFQLPKTARQVEVNYWGNQAEAMAEAGVWLHEPKYTEEAKKIVDTRLKRLFAADGMLMGEIVPADRKSNVRGLAAVDLGYNLEETLPAMLAATEVLGDKTFEEQVVRGALAHLEFLLPDGAIDDTAGSRGYKWTYAGSRTADGVLPLLAKLERRGVPWARRAADRVIALLTRLTGDDGLLYGGLYYRDAREPACLHQTFTHVKGLAEYLVLQKRSSSAVQPQTVLPREQTNRVVSRPSMGAELAAVGPWRATFSASDAYVLPNDARRLSVGGGSPTLLWHERAGLVLAASQAEFFFLESTNQQETRHERTILSTTPRLETANGFLNVEDFNVRISSSFTNGVYLYKARGNLTSMKGEKGAPFAIDYKLTAEGFDVNARADCPCRYYLPIVGGEDTRLTISGNVVTICRGIDTFTLTASAPVKVRRTERGDRSFTTIGGLMTEHLYVDLQPLSDGYAVQLKLRD